MLKRIKDFIHELRTRDKCFERMKDENGKCEGIFGGGAYSEFLDDACMDCPHRSPNGLRRNKQELKQAKEENMKVIDIIQCQLQATRDEHGNLCYGCPVADVEPIDRKACARILLEHLHEPEKNITFRFRKE